MSIIQSLVSEHVLVRLGIHDRCLQRKFVNLWSRGGDEFSVKAVEVEVGEECVGIVLHNLRPGVSRSIAYELLEVDVILHLQGERSSRLKLCRCRFLVVEAAHVHHRDGADGQKCHTQSDKDNRLQSMPEATVFPWFLLLRLQQPIDKYIGK